MKKSHSIDMVNGPLLRNIFAFSIPLMLTTALQMMFQMTDTVVVGRFAGEEALAAVGSTGSLCHMFVALFNGLAMGANVIIAQYIGAGDRKNVSDAVHTSMFISIVSGVFLTVLGQIISRPMLTLMSTPENIIDLSELYLRIYYGGILFLMIYNFGAAVLRSKGDTQRPLYYLMLGGVLNVVLNLIFVIVFKMGVAGVGIATVASNAVAAVLTMTALLKETDATKVHLTKLFKPNVGMIIKVLKIGVPAGIQGMMFTLSNLVVQSSINSFGSSTIVAANSAAINVENIVYIGMNFSQATVTFTGQNIGAKRTDKIAKILGVTMALDAGAALILGVGVLVFGRPILGLFTDSPEVIELGMQRIFWVCLFLGLNSFLDVFISSLRGMGYSTLPTIMMITGICGVRLVWLFTVFPMFRRLEVVYMCYPISWTITSLMLGVMWAVVMARMKKHGIPALK
ncbi:MAG: MATE family efflux transporter [Clostridia bacterium]|nr:MATE family efflux transporter [Clostridia bacterium]